MLSGQSSGDNEQYICLQITAAITLLFVTPLVAEFLLGDLPLKLLPALIVLAPAYGGGALLIRETARRTGRGRPRGRVVDYDRIRNGEEKRYGTLEPNQCRDCAVMPGGYHHPGCDV